MTVEISLGDAIAGLVCEKRALGYKYASEERALARFEVFCAGEFPGLETVTRASVEVCGSTMLSTGCRPPMIGCGRGFTPTRWVCFRRGATVGPGASVVAEGVVDAVLRRL